MKTRSLIYLLPLRLILFVVFQALIALSFYFQQVDNAWHKAEGWWIISGLITNVITFAILSKLFRAEGRNYFDNLIPQRKTWVKDLLLTLAIMVIATPLAMFPNIFLAKILFGSQELTTQLFFRPLPYWVIYSGIIWALGQGLVELQFYFGYLMPQLEKKLNSSVKAWILASLFLSLQHIGIPLIFHWRFILWRFGMFLLFAFFTGWCIKKYPRIFPYMAIIHALMDLSLIFMLLSLK
ncbi:MAG: hypothetical protein JXR22_00960 [Prolixibacteraceae bacterium]|nr:hypothetical protein [Prolixibacteraceae bacterium]